MLQHAVRSADYSIFKKYSNILSIPRELNSYNNKKLSITPLKELEKLRYDKKILTKTGSFK